MTNKNLPMAFSKAISWLSLLLAISSLLLPSLLSVSEAHSHKYVPSSEEIVNGLSLKFYEYNCPDVESIVRKHLKKVFKEDIGQAAGLLRIQFHDCFVLGCDGSVLLDGTTSDPSEQQAIPNRSLRAETFVIINDLRDLLQKQCGRVVSCADITALAARDAVYLSGGPEYTVPLGRRDRLNFATQAEVLANLPGPSNNASVLLTSLATKKFDATDVVALSGAHTIGHAHCGTFFSRLFPTRDPTMDPIFADDLKEICPEKNSTNTANNDIRTPNTFDNKYYVDLVNREGLFTSDQDLYTDKRTRGIVENFAEDEELFFEKFVNVMIKMGQLSVLTGKEGEIRANCSLTNANNPKFVASKEEDYETYAEL